MRKLTIIITAAIVFVVGVATAVAHYAANGGRDDPAKRVTVSTPAR